MVEFNAIGDVSGMINKVVKDLSETSKIVLDIYSKLDQFKTEVDEQIKKDLLKSVGDAIARLQKAANNMGNIAGDLGKIQDKISDIRIGGVGSSDDQALKAVQQQIEDLKRQISAF